MIGVILMFFIVARFAVGLNTGAWRCFRAG